MTTENFKELIKDYFAKTSKDEILEKYPDNSVEIKKLEEFEQLILVNAFEDININHLNGFQETNNYGKKFSEKEIDSLIKEGDERLTRYKSFKAGFDVELSLKEYAQFQKPYPTESMISWFDTDTAKKIENENIQYGYDYALDAVYKDHYSRNLFIEFDLEEFKEGLELLDKYSFREPLNIRIVKNIVDALDFNKVVNSVLENDSSHQSQMIALAKEVDRQISEWDDMTLGFLDIYRDTSFNVISDYNNITTVVVRDKAMIEIDSKDAEIRIYNKSGERLGKTIPFSEFSAEKITNIEINGDDIYFDINTESGEASFGVKAENRGLMYSIYHSDMIDYSIGYDAYTDLENAELDMNKYVQSQQSFVKLEKSNGDEFVEVGNNWVEISVDTSELIDKLFCNVGTIIEDYEAKQISMERIQTISQDKL